MGVPALVIGQEQVAQEKDGPRASAPPSIQDRVRRFAADQQELESFYSISMSGTRHERLRSFLSESREELTQIPIDALSAADQIDLLLLRNHVDAELRALERARRRVEELRPLLPFADDLLALEESRWRHPTVEPEKAAATLDAIAKGIEELRKRLGEKPAEDCEDDAPAQPTPVVAQRTARSIDALEGTIEVWWSNLDAYQPDFAWWARKPYDRLRAALDDYAKFLRDTFPGEKVGDEHLVGDPIGRDALVEEIAREFLPYTPEELLAIGQREFDWCEAEMKKTAALMGCGDDWKQALGRVKEATMPPGAQPQFVLHQAHEAIAFLDARGLVTIPDLCRETWRYEMLTEDGQRTLPYAAYNDQRMMVAYPTRDMSHEDKLMSMRGNNLHATRIVTQHELIPGHHLQRFMTSRHNTHRRLFDTPFWLEGWALYWEMRLDELDFERGPEDRMAMLFWRKHRSARIIVSLGFHLGSMTPSAMIDLLVDGVGHEREGATSEVRRYIGEDYGPLYQCGYMIGGLQIRALQRELVGGGRMTERAFHDAILMENTMPIEILRALLTGAPLAVDAKSSWRFYE